MHSISFFSMVNPLPCSLDSRFASLVLDKKNLKYGVVGGRGGRREGEEGRREGEGVVGRGRLYSPMHGGKMEQSDV